MPLAGRIPAEALDEALALAGVGCGLWQADTGQLRVSARFHELLGSTPESLPESPEAWLALCHAEDRPPFAALFARLAEGSADGTGLTLRLRHASGLWHWFEVKARQSGGAAPTLVTFNEITHRKQAEAALRDSQLRFRALYNTAPLACILWDRQGYISEWNHRAEQMFGWPAGQVIGKQVHRLLLPADLHEPFAAAVKELIQGTGDGSFSGRAICQDGQSRECDWYNVALRAQNGKLTGILSLVLDVTDERLAHQQLEKREKVYRTLVETSPDAILLLDMGGRLQMANQQAHRLFGIDEMLDLTELDVRQLLPDGGSVDFLERPEEFVGFIATRDMAMRRLDNGRRFDGATAFSTVMNSHGHSTGIVLFVRDITAQMQSERELQSHRENLERLVQQRTAELEHAHDSLSQIIDGSPVPTFVIDNDHVVTHWNKACEQVIGVPASEMLGTRDAWRGFYPSQRPVMADLVVIGAVANLHTLYADRFRPSLLIEGGYEAEDYFPAFDRWLFFTAAPLRDKHGNIVGAVETLQDISERKLAEIGLKDAKQAAETAAEAKAAFLANMSHEIRTPMNAVIGLAHLLLQQGDLTGKHRDYVARIHGSGQMLLGLINDILDFSKIEAGRMTLESAEFALDDVLDNVAGVLLQRAQEKGLELQYVVEPDVPPGLVGDPLRLSQILINLIGNALKFTARGSVTVFVRRGASAEGRIGLEIDVQDTGIGMSAEQQANLFQAFNQADTSITRKYGGTGLGLAICKRLVELMQGEIWVTSQPGIGSTFSFTAQFGPGKAALPRARTLRRHALVVDDNPLARAILIRLLEKYGYAAQPAESGRQALSRLGEARTPYDLVTIDFNMPGMDGLELAETIRNQASPCPRLVMVTATDTGTLEGQAGLKAFDAVLNKPVTAAQIGRLVEQAEIRSGPAGDPAPLAGQRILLVEDMPTNQLIACEMLSAFGSTVDVAGDGVEALHKLLDEGLTYDLVLMDVQMPQMDGLEATRRLRASGRLANLPIIAMTAHALDDERQRCLAAGMNDFLTKPIDPAQLQATLKRWRSAAGAGAAASKTDNATMTSPDGLPDLPGIDKQDGLRRMMNKPALYEKVLRDFHARFSDEAAQIRALIDANDFASAERRAHSAKGLAGSIGAGALGAAAKELEAAMRLHDPSSNAIVDQFACELRTVLDGIAAGFGLS